MTSRPQSRNGARAAARNLGWLLSSKGLDGVLGILYLGITTRALGLTDFGRFSLITGASQAIVTLVAFPTWQIIIQYGVNHLLAKDRGALGRLYRAAVMLDIFAASIGALLVFLIIGLFSHMLGIGPDLVGFVLIYSLVQLLTLRSTPLGMLRLHDNYAGAAQADSVTPIVRILGTLAAWAWQPSIEGFLAAWAMAEVLTAIAFWWAVSRSGDLALLRQSHFTRSQINSENPGLLRFAFSTNANVSISLSEKQVPLLLVGAFVGPAAAGAFRLAFQLAQALSKLAQMLTRAAFPELVHAVRTTPPEKVARLLRKMLLASSASAAVIMMLVAASGTMILALVGGKEYVSAYPILLWLAAAACIDLATVGFEPVLMALHRAGTAFVVRVLSALVFIAVTLVLTIRMEAIGASIAMVVGTIVAKAMLAAVTMRAVSQMKSG